mmetsp:Transcript_5892/g.11236  ORF Transcript_5892/g.11236 Transcript_5892/m.11236 type:complete len:243 (-) Transcript_5892:33-761(-)
MGGRKRRLGGGLCWRGGRHVPQVGQFVDAEVFTRAHAPHEVVWVHDSLREQPGHALFHLGQRLAPRTQAVQRLHDEPEGPARAVAEQRSHHHRFGAGRAHRLGQGAGRQRRGSLVAQGEANVLQLAHVAVRARAHRKHKRLDVLRLLGEVHFHHLVVGSGSSTSERLVHEVLYDTLAVVHETVVEHLLARPRIVKRHAGHVDVLVRVLAFVPARPDAHDVWIFIRYFKVRPWCQLWHDFYHC